jgi:lipopolysaccharide export system protein LptA
MTTMRLLGAGFAVAFSITLWAAPASAQIGKQGGPIDITADATEFVEADNLLRWTGKVDARQGDARLLADRMDVYFLGGADDGPGDIDRIVAAGAVAYITPEEVARGDRGVYTAANDTIELCGNVTLVRGQNTSRGECLTVQPSVGRARLTAGTGNASAGRVRAILYPDS